MPSLREAAAQALEALEDFGMKYYENTGEVLHRDVYESLKSALAEEALQRLTDVSQEIEAALAEPVQEPIGYLWPTGRHPEFRFTQQKRDGVDGTPVYAAAPQRKPLTDDEIKKLLIEHAGMTVVFSEVDLRFARAIERAHGIGGQP